MVDFNSFRPAPGAPLSSDAPAIAPGEPLAASASNPPQSPAPPAPAVLAAPAHPPARYAGGKPRTLTFPLDYPIAFAGRTYVEITLRRPSSAEVGLYFEAVVENEGIPPTRHFPIFVDADGAPIPDEVLDLLDDDDDQRVFGAATDFLPQRFLAFREAIRPASILSAGEPTAPTS